MKFRIVQDDDAVTPDFWDPDMAEQPVLHGFNHRRYSFGPKKVRTFKDAATLKKTHWTFTVLMYEHSGIALALASSIEGMRYPFTCQWDTGTLGVVSVPRRRGLTQRRAHAQAKGCIDEWNMYFSGDVWGYLIEDDAGEVLESCFGIYGRDYAEEEAKAMLAACKAHAARPNLTVCP